MGGRRKLELLMLKDGTKRNKPKTCDLYEMEKRVDSQKEDKLGKVNTPIIQTGIRKD